MLCRWLAVLVLTGILLVIEAIAISQGTFTRDQRVLSGSLVQGSRNVSGVPAFETNVPRNVTTAVGQTAFLHCRVHQLGDKELEEVLTMFYKHVKCEIFPLLPPPLLPPLLQLSQNIYVQKAIICHLDTPKLNKCDETVVSDKKAL